MREPLPCGHILELKDGRLLMPAWGAYLLENDGRRACSNPRGQTWDNYNQIAYDAEAG
jgi:hypothetical protein